MNLTRDGALLVNAVCYCRQDTEEDTFKCCNPDCAIWQFHLSCLSIDAIPKTWYCPKCTALPEFKRGGSKQKSTNIISEALKMNSICTCKTVGNKNDKLIKCTNVDCPNGMFFQANCHTSQQTPSQLSHVSTNTKPTVTRLNKH